MILKGQYSPNGVYSRRFVKMLLTQITYIGCLVFQPCVEVFVENMGPCYQSEKTYGGVSAASVNESHMAQVI